MSDRIIPVTWRARSISILIWAITFGLAGLAISILTRVPLVFMIAGLVVGVIVGVVMDRRAMRDRRGVE